MRARVLVLRRRGVLIGHHVDRYRDRAASTAGVDGDADRRQSRHSIGHVRAGTGKLDELFSPHLVCVTDLWFQVRGFEKHDGAGVMQEWIIFPTDDHLTASQRDEVAALEASARTNMTARVR